jgi:hypothetical protein
LNLHNYKYLKITNIDTEKKQGSKWISMARTNTQGMKSNNFIFINNIKITKRYKKKVKDIIIGKLINIILGVCIYTPIRRVSKKISKKCKPLMKHCINKYENIIWKEINNYILKSNSKQNIIYKIIKPYKQCIQNTYQHNLYVVENIFFPSHIEREITSKPKHIPQKQLPPKKINDKIITTKKNNGEPAYTNIKIICVNIAGKLESKVLE